MTRPLRVVHVVTGLGIGGAETALTRLVTRADRSRFESSVVCLADRGLTAEAIEGAGVPVISIGMRKSFSAVVSLGKLRAALRDAEPDVVQTWMYHADLAGGLAARRAGSPPVLWTLRQSNLGREANKRSTLLVIWTCARLSSRIPRLIVCGSEAARSSHIAAGYDRERMVVVPNGFDTGEFRPDAALRSAVRRELGFQEDEILFGLFGRFDVQKDHRNFAIAAGMLAREVPKARFVLCGEGIDHANDRLTGWLASAGAVDRSLLLGRRSDMARLNAALDVAVLSSLGEGFPNVVGEAMACGVPCVVTDVGDARVIVGETGVVVPPRTPEALAAGMAELAKLSADARSRLGEAARQRVMSRYSIDGVVEQYSRIWEGVAGRSSGSEEHFEG